MVHTVHGEKLHFLLVKFHLAELFLLHFICFSLSVLWGEFDVQISSANKLYLHLLQPYLSVMLNKGSLEVLMFSGSHSPRRVIRRPEQGILNDGKEHSLRIERLAGRLACRYRRCLLCTVYWILIVCMRLFPRSFAVQVDEEPKRVATLPNDQPMKLQRIFLGGIPAEVEQTSNRANVPFQGCIWNLMINAMYVSSSLYHYILKARSSSSEVTSCWFFLSDLILN